MQQYTRWLPLIIILALAVPLLAGCADQGSLAETAGYGGPAIVEAIEGTEANRVTLTERAAERLGVLTEEVRMESVGDAERLAIPYSAVIYDIYGVTWAYVSHEPLTFFRVPIVVDYIEGDTAFLLDGPEIGTAVVAVGVAELYGADTGVGK